MSRGVITSLPRETSRALVAPTRLKYPFHMLSQIFLGMSLLGAEWVLYLLMILSVLSVALMIDRAMFYRKATRGLTEFRSKIRQAAASGQWEEAMRLAQSRQK